VVAWAKFRPGHAPRGETFSWRERLISLKDIVGILFLFFCVTGGIYSGVFTPTEAGAVGAFIILIMAILMRRIDWAIFKEIVIETLRVVSSIFLIVLGAYIFIQFLALSRLPVNFAEWVVGLHVHRMIIIAGTVAVFLIMGCFLDALGLILLTVPFISPAIFALGFDPIWFGVIVVKLVEIGLLTPPVGIQAYVLKGVAPELSLREIFSGFIPFFIVDIFIVIGLLIAFPQIATFLTTFMN
jgi:tripartite ATP-independent transporter DctM subunit